MRTLAICLLLAALAPAETAFKVHAAVFSASQTFWPGLDAPGTHASRKAVRSRQDTVLNLVVLPIRIAPADWKETIPCDSCHRLSPNGMEFFLENYLAERLRRRFPGHTVSLAAPHEPLLQAAHVRLLDYQDSLRLPWERWFDGYAEGLIYRPRDPMTSARDIRRLDKLGGHLGATHLLLPAKVWVRIAPRGRDLHTGDLEWGFHLMFWNVVEGRVEWAMALSERAPGVDLDAALDGRLDKALWSAWERMPGDLAALWKAEPR